MNVKIVNFNAEWNVKWIAYSLYYLSVYIDMGTGASDTVNLALDFSDATNLANQRFFEIKVTQLPCSSEYQ